MKYGYRIWNGCKRKRIYLTAEDAAKAARHAEQTFGKPMTIYACPYQNHFHVARVKEQR